MEGERERESQKEEGGRKDDRCAIAAAVAARLTSGRRCRTGGLGLCLTRAPIAWPPPMAARNGPNQASEKREFETKWEILRIAVVVVVVLLVVVVVVSVQLIPRKGRRHRRLMLPILLKRSVYLGDTNGLDWRAAL